MTSNDSKITKHTWRMIAEEEEEPTQIIQHGIGHCAARGDQCLEGICYPLCGMRCFPLNLLYSCEKFQMVGKDAVTFTERTSHQALTVSLENPQAC